MGYWNALATGQGRPLCAGNQSAGDAGRFIESERFSPGVPAAAQAAAPSRLGSRVDVAAVRRATHKTRTPTFTCCACSTQATRGFLRKSSGAPVT